MNDTPTLPKTLRRLAGLLPMRVRVDAVSVVGNTIRVANNAEVRVRGVWQYVYYITPDSPDWAHTPSEMYLEAALREEITFRGWHWTMETMLDGRVAANVIPDWERRASWGRGRASTPAQALALALLNAL